MLSNRRLVLICAIFLGGNLALLGLFVKYNTGEKCYITINLHQKNHPVMPDDFLSIGIDTSEIQNYDNVDFNDTKLRELTAALAPARLRLGGTMSERLIFSPEDEFTASCDECCDSSKTNSTCSAVRKLCSHKFLPFFILTGKKWTEINEFCVNTNIKLLFTFNALLRNDDEWDSQNAVEILEYSRIKNFDIDFQLGNEPNSFRHVFNISLSPQTLAHDFKKLRKLLNHHGYKKSLLVGPDTTRPQEQQPNCLKYMVEFLGNGSHFINVRSWHQYYMNSRTAKLEDFWDPKTFNLLQQQIAVMQNHTKKYHNIPMWLSETSTSYGGGASGISNTYAGSPLWIDKLGLSAKHNITTVVRQSLYGGNYSLISDDLEPLPDWWVSVLYKKLVGNKVLQLNCSCSHYQRFYAHCANRKYTNDTTAITIFAVNLKMAKVRLLLNGTAFHSRNMKIDEYIISAPSNNRRSKRVLLNGWPLYYQSPKIDLQPHHIRHGNHISMPPYSIGFWVIKNTSIKICK